MNPQKNTNLEDSKLKTFLHDTLAHDNAPSYPVWLQKVVWFRRYYPDQHGDSNSPSLRYGGYKKNQTSLVKIASI